MFNPHKHSSYYIVAMVVSLSLMAGSLQACRPKTAPVRAGTLQDIDNPSRINKPTLVEIYADWCPSCKNVAPAWTTLRKRYAGRVDFVTLDVSNARTSRQSEQTAHKLGLAKWYMMYKSHTAMIGLFIPGHNDSVNVFIDEPDPKIYESALTPYLKN